MSEDESMKQRHRPLYDIAGEICRTWTKVHPTAWPYLKAMLDLDQIEGMYGLDTASHIVLYFLANAQGFRGPDARRIKIELKEILKSMNEGIAAQNHGIAYSGPINDGIKLVK